MSERRFDPTIPRRAYWRGATAVPTRCPECGEALIPDFQSYILAIKKGKEVETYVTGNRDGAFCPACPVVVLDKERFAELAALERQGDIQFMVLGTLPTEDVDVDEPRIGELTWPRMTRKGMGVEKLGRNDPCPCGSGKKYKKCCGK